MVIIGKFVTIVLPWYIKGSHIFDLGSLQNSALKEINLLAMPPELTNVSKIDDNADLHDFYSEVIQLDAAESSGVWDGGLIKAIDPNYENYNKEKQLCNNITIANNSFVPYIDSHGKNNSIQWNYRTALFDVGLVKFMIMFLVTLWSAVSIKMAKRGVDF